MLRTVLVGELALTVGILIGLCISNAGDRFWSPPHAVAAEEPISTELSTGMTSIRPTWQAVVDCFTPRQLLHVHLTTSRASLRVHVLDRDQVNRRIGRFAVHRSLRLVAPALRTLEYSRSLEHSRTPDHSVTINEAVVDFGLRKLPDDPNAMGLWSLAPIRACMQRSGIRYTHVREDRCDYDARAGASSHHIMRLKIERASVSALTALLQDFERSGLTPCGIDVARKTAQQAFRGYLSLGRWMAR